MHKILTYALLVTFSYSTAQTTIKLDSTVLKVDTVISGLDIPWEIIWGFDNQIWFTERHGKISRVNPESGARKILLDYRKNVYQFNESGMLGLFLHPDFEIKPLVYVAYTYLNNSQVRERISRFTYGNDTLTNEEILVDDIPGNTTHIGCRFLLLPDNTLLFSTGDAQKSNDAQNPVLLNGKILRMTLDGDIPSDNPSSSSYVWSWGMRNTQGLAIGPNGFIYGSEHGPTSDDELNVLIKGRNFGWPTVEGECNSAPELEFCADSNVVEPIFTWTPTIAPSDLIYYQHTAIPEFNGKLLMTVLKNKKIIAFDLNAQGTEVIKNTSYFSQDFGRIRDICADKNGTIYLATNGSAWSNNEPNTHSILRLRNVKNLSKAELVSNGLEIKLYPNPSSAGFVLELPRGYSNGRVIIINSIGAVVETIPAENTNKIEYKRNPLVSDGVYLIHYEVNGVSSTIKWFCVSN